MDDTIIFEEPTDDRDTSERTPDDVVGGDIIWDIVDSVTETRSAGQDNLTDITDGQLNATSGGDFLSDVALWDV